MKRLALDTIIKVEKHKRTQRALKKNDVNYNNNKINRGPVAGRWGGDFCGRITWFSGETDKGSVIDNRVWREDKKKLTANKGQWRGGGNYENIREPYMGIRLIVLSLAVLRQL